MAEEETDRISKRQGNLKPRLKHIPRDIILSRWKILDENAQGRVRDALHSVEMPILARLSSEQEKVEAQGVIGSLTRTLSKRLPKMVFPPKTKEELFDRGELAKSNRNLRLQLAASLNSKALLIVEVEKLKRALDSEQQEVEELGVLL